MIKKLVSTLISAVLVLNLAVFPVFAEQTDSATYVSEPSGESSGTAFESDYRAEYSVKDSWGNNQIIEIKITNTSEEDLTAWAVRFEADGEIEDLWGASIYKHEENTYVLEGTPYGSTIKPNASAVLGYKYILETGAKPENIYVYSLTDDKKSYTVETRKMSGWDDEAVINLIITNNSENPIKYWSLSFEADFEISQIWNGKVLYSNENTYTIGFDDNTQIIQPNSAVTIGMQCKKVSDISVRNEKLTDNILELNMESLYAYGTYDEETESIILNWNSNIKEGYFTVLSSTDGTGFSQVETVRDTDSYSYTDDLTAENIYFEVKQTAKDGQVKESNIIKMVKTEDGYEMETIDTDEDGLPDLMEFMYGTDYLNPDTDEDGLTDYEELYLTGTDPLKADTDGNVISDPDEDPDNDSLTNLEEIELGTNPQSDDTDMDGLKDGEEINQYKTDPLKYDTDEDGISDGNEIIIGLDPLNPATHGVPDNEYTFEQSVPSKSSAFELINTDENPFEMSISLKAAGNAENSIIVGKSGYSNVIKNDFIPDSGDFSAYTDEFDGIKRYYIFKYFEDENMLMPIKTSVNENNNTVSATTDCFGTYCIVDMEKWFINMGINPEEVYADIPQPMLMSIELESNSDYIEISPEEKEKIAFGQNKNRTLMSAALTGNQLIKGEYVGYNVTPNGQFSIGTTIGNPDISSDDNQSLLYSYPGGSTSYTTIRVNGSSNQIAGTNTKESSTAIATKNSYSGIDVKQTLDIVENNATGRKDVVQIKYTVTNTTDENQSVGCRIMMDTMLGNNDHAPFRVPGRNVTTETEYAGSSIPQIWQAFDSLQKPGVVAQGTFYKGMMKPDKVQFVNWGRVTGTPWDYRITNGMNNGDSAVTVTWNEKELKSGESREYITYYGLSEYESDLRPPVTLSVSSDNKFEQNNGKYPEMMIYSYIENIGTGNAKNVEVSIELPEELELVSNRQGYTATTNKVWDILKSKETQNCSWLLRVKSNYNNSDDNKVDVIVKLKYSDESGLVEEKFITKSILIPAVQFSAITLTGYNTITLDKVLSDLNKADKDNDGLSDWDEADTRLINAINPLKDEHIISRGDLPTIAEVQNYLAKTHNKDLFYVEDGFEIFKDKYSFLNHGMWMTQLYTLPVLPINSDPTKLDSDGDGLKDTDEVIEKRLRYSFKYYDDELYPLHMQHPKWEFKFTNFDITFDDAVNIQYNYCNKWSTPSTISKTSEYAVKLNSDEFNQRINEILKYNESNKNGIKNKSDLIKRSADSNSTLITKKGVKYSLNPKSYLNEDGIYAFLTLNLHQNIVDINLINEMLTNTYFDTGIANTSKEDFALFFYDTGVDIDPYYLFIKTIEENGTNVYKDNIKDYSKYINGEIKKYVFGGLNANNGTAYNDTVNMSPDDWNTPIKGLKGLAEFTVQKYVNKGKNTSYLLRFDLNSVCIGNDPVQYSTASNIAMSHSKLYKKMTFDIPVFQDDVR